MGTNSNDTPSGRTPVDPREEAPLVDLFAADDEDATTGERPFPSRPVETQQPSPPALVAKASLPPTPPLGAPSNSTTTLSRSGERPTSIAPAPPPPKLPPAGGVHVPRPMVEATSAPSSAGRQPPSTRPAVTLRRDEEATQAHAVPVPRALSPRQSIFAGSVLGAAIGDALGHPAEFVDSFDALRAQFGPDGITGYSLYWEKDGRRFAPFTDDTQMAEVVMEALVGATDLEATMQDLATRFISWKNEPKGGHRGPGRACLAGCEALERGIPWHAAGAPDAGGCGSVMRAYPFGLVFSESLGKAELWAVEQSRLTHRDPIALAACAAMAVGVALVVRGARFSHVFPEMVGAACRYSPKTAAMMATALDEAKNGTPPTVTLDRLRGWAAHEAIAAAIYVTARNTKNPRAGLLEAANTPGDSDSIASLVGALLGAHHGFMALPSPLVQDLERKDELLALAVRSADVASS